MVKSFYYTKITLKETKDYFCDRNGFLKNLYFNSCRPIKLEKSKGFLKRHRAEPYAGNLLADLHFFEDIDRILKEGLLFRIINIFFYIFIT
jgi:hypothetical protein